MAVLAGVHRCTDIIRDLNRRCCVCMALVIVTDELQMKPYIEVYTCCEMERRAQML